MSTETREGQDCPGCGTTFMPDKGAFRGHKDAMFCPVHRAAPKLLEALKGLVGVADTRGVETLQYFFERVIAEVPNARDAIALAEEDK